MRTISTAWLRRVAIVTGAVAMVSGVMLLVQAWAEPLSAAAHALVIGVFTVSMFAGVGFALAAMDRDPDTP